MMARRAEVFPTTGAREIFPRELQGERKTLGLNFTQNIDYHSDCHGSSTLDENVSLTQFIYEKEIHFTFSFLQPSRFNCVCSLPGWHWRGAVGDGCIFKRLRTAKRRKQQPIANETGFPRQPESRCSAHGWSCPSEPRFARPPIFTKRSGNRSATPDAIPIPGRRTTTFSIGDFIATRSISD